MAATKRHVLGLIGWLAIVALAGAIGAVASVDADSFYRALDLPRWAPPAAVFGPVWSVLYALMAYAEWSVWRVRGFHAARGALGLFLAQLALNASWSWVFFAWHRGGLAFGVIVLLCGLVAATVAAFWRVDRVAGAVLLPYLAWLGYAAALNFFVWRLNPQALGA